MTITIFVCKEKSMWQRISRSFAAKLNFYILFSLFLLWGMVFMVFHHYATRFIEKQTYDKLDEAAERTNLKITRLLRIIEKKT